MKVKLATSFYGVGNFRKKKVFQNFEGSYLKNYLELKAEIVNITLTYQNKHLVKISEKLRHDVSQFDRAYKKWHLMYFLKFVISGYD